MGCGRSRCRSHHRQPSGIDPWCSNRCRGGSSGRRVPAGRRLLRPPASSSSSSSVVITVGSGITWASLWLATRVDGLRVGVGGLRSAVGSGLRSVVGSRLRSRVDPWLVSRISTLRSHKAIWLLRLTVTWVASWDHALGNRRLGLSISSVCRIEAGQDRIRCQQQRGKTG